MVIYVVTGGFILFDILTGVLKGIHSKSIDSTILREGLFHKLAEVLALVGSGLLTLVCDYIQLGFSMPLLQPVSVYICVMELISILENIGEINPDLKILFRPYLAKLKEEKEDEVQ